MVSVFKANVTAHLGEGNGKTESAIYLHTVSIVPPVKTSPSCYLATAMAGKRDVGANIILFDKKPGKPRDKKTWKTRR